MTERRGRRARIAAYSLMSRLAEWMNGIRRDDPVRYADLRTSMCDARVALNTAQGSLCDRNGFVSTPLAQAERDAVGLDQEAPALITLIRRDGNWCWSHDDGGSDDCTPMDWYTNLLSAALAAGHHIHYCGSTQ